MRIVIIIAPLWILCLITGCENESAEDTGQNQEIADNDSEPVDIQNLPSDVDSINQSRIDTDQLLSWLQTNNYEDQAGRLDIFDDLTLSYEFDRHNQVGPGLDNYRLNILEPEDGDMLISVSENRLSGRIELTQSGRVILIRSDQQGDYYAIEVDPTGEDILDGSEPLEVN